MWIVLLNMIVVSAILWIIIGISIFLTCLAIGLVIGSIIRHGVKKKSGVKTHLVGMWIGIVMLVLPWLFVIFIIISAKVYDAKYNRWDVSRIVLAEAALDESGEELYDIFAPDVVEECEITEDDVEEFLQKCVIENDSDQDMTRYISHSGLDNHYRPYISHENDRTQMCFEYTMFDVNGAGGELYIAGVDGDSENESAIGVYYLSYTMGDYNYTLGKRPPKEN